MTDANSLAVASSVLPVVAEPDRLPALVYLGRLSEGSRPTMLQALNVIAGVLTDGREDARSCRWPLLRYQHTQAVRARLAERYAPATANKMLAALRGVLQECWRLGLMDAEDFHRAADLKVIKAQTLPRGRALPVNEQTALFTSCAADSTAAGRRDAALIAVLVGAGLRRAESVALDLADYDPVEASLKVRGGKGRKDRIAYLGDGGELAMDAWLAVRGATPGALLCPVSQLGVVDVRQLSPQAVYNILAKRRKAAGIPAFGPHDMRRTFISGLFDAGADPSAVQQLAGHATIATTMRYDRRGERAKRKAAGLLRVPFVS